MTRATSRSRSNGGSQESSTIKQFGVPSQTYGMFFFVGVCFPVKTCKNYGRTPSRQEEDEFQEVLAAKLQSEAWKRELKFEYLEDHPS